MRRASADYRFGNSAGLFVYYRPFSVVYRSKIVVGNKKLTCNTTIGFNKYLSVYDGNYKESFVPLENSYESDTKF